MELIAVLLYLLAVAAAQEAVTLPASCSRISKMKVPWNSLRALYLDGSTDYDDNMSELGRIVGGDEVEPHSLPYQVGMFIAVPNGTSFCGGSLISPEWVLTAAHCVDPGSHFTVILGAHSILKNETSQVRLETTEKIVHPEWEPSELRNDIALLRLPEKVEYNDKIQPIRLPSRADINQKFVREDVLLSGWGKPSDSADGISPVLRAVTKPVISWFRCFLGYGPSIRETHICTSGSRGQSTCNGDSGGPLVLTGSDSTRTQIGLVSFGIRLGCEVGWPSVYTRVTSYLDWISNVTSVAVQDGN